MEELERLLPVHVVQLADVLDRVGLVVEAHGGADLAGVGLGAGVDEQVLQQGCDSIHLKTSRKSPQKPNLKRIYSVAHHVD